MPGPFEYPSGVAKFKGNDKYENLYNVHVRRALQKLLSNPGLELHFFNDATSFGGRSAKNFKFERKESSRAHIGNGLFCIRANEVCTQDIVLNIGPIGL